MTQPQEVVEFWFSDEELTPERAVELNRRWFQSDSRFDEQIHERFGDLPDKAQAGELDGWMDQAGSTLGLVLVLDQFPRNIYRGSPRAFSYDAKARQVLLQGLSKDFHLSLHPLQRAFLYLPFEHAEDAQLQRRSVTLFTELKHSVDEAWVKIVENSLDYAVAHLKIIEEFGRFPHRNEVLGRESTPKETQYLEEGGRTF
ncbi:MAG: DUF924 family protein [Pseudomonadota bacterium]